MMTLREYAADQGVSYEAVRKQLKRYETELSGHISKEKGVQYLDDYAVHFLTEKRNAQPIVIVNKDQTAHINDLKKDLAVVQALLKQREIDYEKAQNLASKRLEEISNLKYLEKENKRLEATLNNFESANKEKDDEIHLLKNELEKKAKELGTFKKTWYGYKKIK